MAAKISKTIAEKLTTALADDNHEMIGARFNTEQAMMRQGLVRHQQLKTRILDKRGHQVRTHGMVLTEKGVAEAQRLEREANPPVEDITREDVEEGKRNALQWLGYGDARRTAEKAPASEVLAGEFKRAGAVMRKVLKKRQGPQIETQALNYYDRVTKLLAAARRFEALDAKAAEAPAEPTLTHPAEVNGRFVTLTHGGQFLAYGPADGETNFFDGPWLDALEKVRALPARLFPPEPHTPASPFQPSQDDDPMGTPFDADLLPEAAETLAADESAQDRSGEPSDTWAVKNEAGEVLAHVHGVFAKEAQKEAYKLPLVQKVAAKEGGVYLRRLMHEAAEAWTPEAERASSMAALEGVDTRGMTDSSDGYGRSWVYEGSRVRVWAADEGGVTWWHAEGASGHNVLITRFAADAFTEADVQHRQEGSAASVDTSTEGRGDGWEGGAVLDAKPLNVVAEFPAQVRTKLAEIMSAGPAAADEQALLDLGGDVADALHMGGVDFPEHDALLKEIGDARMTLV